MASYGQQSYGTQTDYSARPPFVYDSGLGYDTNAAKLTGAGGGGGGASSGFVFRSPAMTAPAMAAPAMQSPAFKSTS